MNTTYNRSIGMTPAEASEGWLAAVFPESSFRQQFDGKFASFDILKRRQEIILEWIRQAHEETVSENKIRYDRRHRNQTFAVGDKVYIYIHHLRQFSHKFQVRWIGPFTIAEVMKTGDAPNGNYRINLPDTLRRLHPIFHTSHLRPYVELLEGQPKDDRPPALSDIGLDNIFELEAISVHRKLANGRVEFFVKWKVYPITDNTWEPAENILVGAKRTLKNYCAAQNIDLKDLINVVYLVDYPSPTVTLAVIY